MALYFFQMLKLVKRFWAQRTRSVGKRLSLKRWGRSVLFIVETVFAPTAAEGSLDTVSPLRPQTLQAHSAQRSPHAARGRGQRTRGLLPPCASCLLESPRFLPPPASGAARGSRPPSRPRPAPLGLGACPAPLPAQSSGPFQLPLPQPHNHNHGSQAGSAPGLLAPAPQLLSRGLE